MSVAARPGSLASALKNLSAVLMLPLAAMAQSSGDPTNPLMGSVGIHDPSALVKDGSTYYVYASHQGAKTSADRITWKNGTRTFPTQLAWWKECDDAPEIWAAEVAYFNGLYHYYYSVSSWGNVTTSCIGVATSKSLDPNSPNYKWTDVGKVVDGVTGSANGSGTVNVIDPGIYQENGKVYLTYGSFHAGMRMIEINPATGLALPGAKPTVITKKLGEASYVFKANDWYYFSCSRGGCCNGMESTYQVVYGRSKTLAGPYATKAGKSFLDNNFDVLLAGDATHPGQGGQSFFVDHDTLFMVYHAYTAPNGNSLLNIKPVYGTSDGWLTMVPSQGTVVKVTAPVKLADPGSVSAPIRPSQRLAAGISISGLNAPKGAYDFVYDLTGEKNRPDLQKALPSGYHIFGNVKAPE